MYVNARKRTNSKGKVTFYIYLCESYRVDGVVKNTQQYVGKINEERLAEYDYSFLETPHIELSIDEERIITDKLKSLSNQILQNGE